MFQLFEIFGRITSGLHARRQLVIGTEPVSMFRMLDGFLGKICTQFDSSLVKVGTFKGAKGTFIVEIVLTKYDV